MQSPEFAHHIRKVNVSDLVGVELTILIPSTSSPFKRPTERKKQMNTTTSLDSSILRRNSLLFWYTLVIPVAIIRIGINCILNPVGASTACGIPIHDPAVFPFMWVK
jgi:hypothetical protein